MTVLRWTRRVRRISRRLRRRSGPRVLVLLYHRIAELRSDPWLLSVTPRHFAEHLEILQRYAKPIPLRDLAQALLRAEIPDRSVVITFDDGYADNLHNAKPLLERYDIPATVFLTTGYIGAEHEFWWDELDRLLLHPGCLPGMLRLQVNGSTYRWELGKAALYDEESFRGHRHWRAWESCPSTRHSLYLSLWNLLHPLREEEQRRILDELSRWASAGPVGRLTYRPLSPEEVLTLAQGKLVEVGAHTVSHPALSALPEGSQRDEIVGSKAYLQEILGRPVTSFSYPYGRRSDYDATTIDLIRQAEFACSCANFVGVVRRNTDPFQLPRLQVQDWDGDGFAERLSRWFDE